MGRRNPNGRSSIYHGSDGKWHGRVTMGIRDDGKPDRRHVKRKKRADAVAKVRELEKERDSGRVRKPGHKWTVESWLTHWLHNIAKDSLRQTAFDAYEVAVRVHLIPGIGAHKLDRLQPEHLERLYARMLANGSKPGRVHQVHRTIRTALGVAVKREHIGRNPAAIAKAPSLTDDEEVEPYSVDEIQKILTEASKLRTAARWAIALSIGLRQGEALGLKWEDIDLDAGTLRVRRARLRPKYEHGCGGTCGRKAGLCKQRKQVTPDVGPLKSKASRRTIGLPPELIVVLNTHREAQSREREAARQLWHDEGYVFTTPTGRPLNPNSDFHEWKALLEATGVRDARLHDARHTAATMLLALGISHRAAMDVMGWSTMEMVKRYQHVTDPIRQDIAQRVGGLLWAPQDEAQQEDSDRRDPP
ncbi:MAG: tyrosine-type recombinase/integrase [Propionibacteriales bacterium]|nr:tyrosine-type recombinase/integrase [Propionibacteriales bacterium]